MSKADRIFEMIRSDSYKDRMIGEYHELARRAAALDAMLRKWSNNELGFTPTCPRKLLEKQLDVMEDYKTILEARAKIEGIELFPIGLD